MRLKIDGTKGPVSPIPKEAVDGSRPETGPSTMFNPIPPSIAAFHAKSQAFYLRFSFRVACHGRGLPPKGSRWVHFVADGSHGSPRKAKNDPFPSVHGRLKAVTDMVTFQNYAGLLR